MSSSPNSRDSAGATEPSWKRLFSPGGFDWAFRMRAGDAESFFARWDRGGGLLAEKRHWLETRPEWFLAVTPPGEALVAAAWDRALEWGHVSAPENGRRDLQPLALQWEPDLLVVDHATMTVAAGAVCFPSSWKLKDAVGRPVHAVHDHVPRLNPQIGDKIDRFLRQLAPGRAFRRENWSLTRTAERNYHPALRRRPLDATVALDELFLRIEHQLFTGVPGGILMGIRIETCPLADLAADPAAWNAAAGKVRTMPDDVAAYKSMGTAREAVVRAMHAFRALEG